MIIRRAEIHCFWLIDHVGVRAHWKFIDGIDANAFLPHCVFALAMQQHSVNNLAVYRALVGTSLLNWWERITDRELHHAECSGRG